MAETTHSDSELLHVIQTIRTTLPISFESKEWGTSDTILIYENETRKRFVEIPSRWYRDYFHLRRFAVSEVLRKLSLEFEVMTLTPNVTDNLHIYDISLDAMALIRCNLNAQGSGILTELIDALHRYGVGPEVMRILRIRMGINRAVGQPPYLYLGDIETL